jgi:hypothetical protein
MVLTLLMSRFVEAPPWNMHDSLFTFLTFHFSNNWLKLEATNVEVIRLTFSTRHSMFLVSHSNDWFKLFARQNMKLNDSVKWNVQDISVIFDASRSNIVIKRHKMSIPTSNGEGSCWCLIGAPQFNGLSNGYII